MLEMIHFVDKCRLMMYSVLGETQDVKYTHSSIFYENTTYSRL